MGYYIKRSPVSIILHSLMSSHGDTRLLAANPRSQLHSKNKNTNEKAGCIRILNFNQCQFDCYTDLLPDSTTSPTALRSCMHSAHVFEGRLSKSADCTVLLSSGAHISPSVPLGAKIP